MKKVILLTALIAGFILSANIQTVQAGERPTVYTIFEDDGFVDVRLEDLNEQVQQAINSLTDEYDVQAIKYNAEKQLTKVKLTKRDDQTSITILFNDQGEKVEKDRMENQSEQQQSEQLQELERQGQEQQLELQQPPSVEQAGVNQDKGFQNSKYEDLNEGVQEAVRQFADEYDITAIQYDSDKKIAKISGRNKEDQSEKTIYFNDEGKEVNLDEQRTEAEHTEREETQTPKG